MGDCPNWFDFNSFISKGLHKCFVLIPVLNDMRPVANCNRYFHSLLRQFFFSIVKKISFFSKFWFDELKVCQYFGFKVKKSIFGGSSGYLGQNLFKFWFLRLKKTILGIDFGC